MANKIDKISAQRCKEIFSVNIYTLPKIKYAFFVKTYHPFIIVGAPYGALRLLSIVA